MLRLSAYKTWTVGIRHGAWAHTEDAACCVSTKTLCPYLICGHLPSVVTSGKLHSYHL
jgi:hypothetical protein